MIFRKEPSSLNILNFQNKVMTRVAFSLNNHQGIALFSSKVQAGFPSPSDDYIEQYLDLNTFFIPHPSATIAVRASSIGLIGAGVFKGDWLLVDKSLAPVPGRQVVAEVEGELKLLRLRKQQGRVQLLTPQGTILVPFEMIILGVVILVLHEVS